MKVAQSLATIFAIAISLVSVEARAAEAGPHFLEPQDGAWVEARSLVKISLARLEDEVKVIEWYVDGIMSLKNSDTFIWYVEESLSGGPHYITAFLYNKDGDRNAVRPLIINVKAKHPSAGSTVESAGSTATR